MTVGSRFARYMNPILAALHDLGGSARPGEVFDWIADDLGTSEQERTDEHRSGGSRFENDVAWARFYLVRSGYLDSSRRGVWSLTELGRRTDKLSDEQISEIIRVVQETAPRRTIEEPTPEQLEKEATAQAETAAPEDVPSGYRERALEIMGKLPPNGFERLCQRLLRESDFQQVKITGRSGDGGIDGQALVNLLEKLELGLIPRTTYEVDTKFFEEFDH